MFAPLFETSRFEKRKNEISQLPHITYRAEPTVFVKGPQLLRSAHGNFCYVTQLS